MKTIAPPLWVLLKAVNGEIVPSDYALSAAAANLNLITWTVERSGRIREDDLEDPNKYYFRSLLSAVKDDSVVYPVIDQLTRHVAVKGIFQTGRPQ